MKIKDIAKDLHLSISTVSKALNGAFDVSDETKQLVINYAREHNYKSRDQRLSVKKIRRLCFVYDNESAILMSLCNSFNKEARKNNFEVIQIPSTSILDDYDEFMKNNNFDGAFITGLNYNSILAKKLLNCKTPTVVYDSDLSGSKISTISNENINSIKNLFEYLYNLGHRKIGFVGGDKNSFINNERYAGYIISHSLKNLEYNPKYVYFGDFSQQAGYAAAKYFINSDVTAIICAADIIAIGLMNGLRELGVNVPSDISITGYDDIEMASLIIPSLTTIKQNIDEIGKIALQNIMSMLMNRMPQRIIVNGSIIIRNSIDKAKNA